jgi:hypothetical protein
MRMFPFLAATCVCGSAIACLSPAIAGSVREIPLDFAQKGVSIGVTPKGVSIDLGSESVGSMIITDRRDILIKRIGNSVYLQRISHQQIDGMIGSGDGTSVLRIWTTSGKRLIFNLRLSTGGSTDISLTSSSSPPLSDPKPLAVKSLKGIKRKKILPDSFKPLDDSPYPFVDPISTNITPIDLKQAPIEKKEKALPVALKSDRTRLISSEISTSKTSRKPKSDSFPILRTIQETPSQRALRDINQAPSDVLPEDKSTKFYNKQDVPSFKAYRPIKTQAQAKALIYGLNLARFAKGSDRIPFGSPTWNGIQSVVAHIKRGTSLELAIKRTRVDGKLIDRLLKDGGFAK